MDNPLFDVVNFLQKPGWPTPVFWLLLAGGVAVAIYAFAAIPGQRSFANVWNCVFRMLIGVMWWQATLGNCPPLIPTSLASLSVKPVLPFG